jgi:quercetin dioxygenase-like cupin family protein
MSAQPVFCPTANDGAKLRVTGDSVRVLATKNDTDQKFEVFEFTAMRDSGPPPHAHPWSEAYLMVRGDMEVLVDGRAVDVAAGGFVHIPAGVVHALRVTSDIATFFVITGPGNLSAMLGELHDQSDFPTIVEIALRNGLELATAASS